MRTQRGRRALDQEPLTALPEAGMHNSYDASGNARHCPCSEFWAGNAEPGVLVAHMDGDPEARLTFEQIPRKAWKDWSS